MNIDSRYVRIEYIGTTYHFNATKNSMVWERNTKEIMGKITGVAFEAFQAVIM